MLSTLSPTVALFNPNRVISRQMDIKLRHEQILETSGNVYFWQRERMTSGLDGSENKKSG